MTEDPARSRFFLLSLARIGGVAITVLGLLIATEAVRIGPREVGYALILVGLAETALLPRFLARQWRTPPNP